ncbi:acyltransferase family protein [Nocardiopsis suaedae]|uniref:Acyltransferase family protein n=1 Tax=Nocardiopsis suaedae TaxID=3018444 RepID=A0ABT4THI6_9ACTN|nr:acyltransferase family protein [Nocardiopsis suaedae]MDA2804164.1 acyltransferase family protein [Nocardiopsis suaedae]
MTTQSQPAPPTTAPTAPAPRRFFPEVQGLRALAVGLVVAYHIDKDLLPGGYIGVDVFFVISGFLITTLLLREAREKGRVSLSGFYIRRVRRILPAATAVLAVTGAAAVLLLPSAQLLDTAKQILASAAYVQNLLLARESVDYLAAGSAESPVQHFWSLAVEEQFYLVWPLLFIGWTALPGHLRRARALLLGGGGVIAVSFAFSVWTTLNDPSPAYFLPQTRMWELAVGGVLAIVLTYRRLPERVRAGLGWAGLLAVIASAATYDDAVAFPGWAAALPVLGTAAVIAAGHTTGPLSTYRLLSAAPARFVGDISYALYLWHWPLIVFTLAATGSHSLGLAGGLAVAAGSVLLAWATKVAVEDPVRTGGLLKTGRSALAFAVAAVLAAATVSAVQYGHVQAKRNVAFDPAVHVGPQALSDPAPEGDAAADIYPSPVDALDDLPSVYDDDCQAMPGDRAADPCVYGPEDADVQVAVVGDSHAAHWVPAVRGVAEEHGWRVSTFTKSSCPFTAETVTRASDDDRPYEECADWNEDVVDQLTGGVEPDLVFTSARSSAASAQAGGGEEGKRRIAEGMAEQWAAVEEAGGSVVAIADTPSQRARVPECVELNPDDPSVCAKERDDALDEEDPQLMAAEMDGAGAKVVDLNDRLCTDDRCPAVVGNVLVYRDSHHLTATYSQMLAADLEKEAADPLSRL